MSKRFPIPVSDLKSYEIDETGSVWKQNGHRSGKKRRLAALPFREAIQVVGDRASLYRAPWPLIPGVWQLRFAGELPTAPWLAQTSLEQFLRQHAFGAKRTHPDWWPRWSFRVEAAATAIADEQEPLWTVFPNIECGSDAWRRFVNETWPDGVADRPANRAPILLLGPVAFAAIESLSTDEVSETVLSCANQHPLTDNGA